MLFSVKDLTEVDAFYFDEVNLECYFEVHLSFNLGHILYNGL
jgi:hypothetical protein